MCSDAPDIIDLQRLFKLNQALIYYMIQSLF